MSRRSIRALLALSSCSLALTSVALAQDRAAGAAATSETTLEEISVTTDAAVVKPQAGPSASPGYVGGVTGIGGSLLTVNSASAGILTGAQVNNRPVTRPGEVLEAVPGLIVTQHSGEGKANQFFLRGFNLDHGTDIALFLDGMPLNMRSHAHGQGYADINFLIPELVGAVEFHKGPYFVRDGDFASAGSVRIDYLDSTPKNLALTSIGSFGYKRALNIVSAPLAEGNLLLAADAQLYDGPWVVPDALRKISTVARYSQGTALDGFSVTGMAYAARWTATNQVPERAIVSGLISRFGTINPTDGGDTSRFSLSGRFSATDDTGVTRASAYVIRSQLNLFNDFTYFLNDPVNGDQFHQLDQRIIGGGEALHIFQGDLFGLPMENEIGVQTRTDSIRVGLFNTTARQYRSGILDDRVLETSGAFYFDNRVRWTDWLRTSLGFRADGYYASVVSDTPANSGKARDAIVNPKLGLVLGPWFDTELYVNYGGGFHSNDVRGVTATVEPLDGRPATVESADPVLAAIEAHKAAYSGWDRLASVSNGMLSNAPRYAEAEADAYLPGRREIRAYEALFVARPVTLQGAKALAEYLAVAVRRASSNPEPSDGERALQTVAGALTRLLGGHWGAGESTPSLSRDESGLTNDIVDGWTAWGALLGQLEDETPYELAMVRRRELLNAAMELPATAESIAPKALASAWMEWVQAERPGQPRNRYDFADRFLYDIHATIMGQGAAGGGQGQASRSINARPNLVGMVDFTSATMDELRALHDIADEVGSIAYAMTWGDRCNDRTWSARGMPGGSFNAAGILMDWLGDALADVETAVLDEVKRRAPESATDRSTRLELMARRILEGNDADQIEAFGRELMSHAAAERARS